MTDMNGQSEALSYRCVLPQCATKDAGTIGFPTAQGLTMHDNRVHKGMGPGNRGKGKRTSCPVCRRVLVNVDQHVRNMHPVEYAQQRNKRERLTVQVEDPQPTMTLSNGAVVFEVSNNYIPLTAPDGSTWLAFRVIEP